MCLETNLSKYAVLAIIYETYHIVPPGGEIPCSFFTVEGVEGLVNEKAISREVATLIYKIMTARGENE